MSTPEKKFTHNYTPEKLAEFTFSALLDMKGRALKNGSPDLVAMCDFEIAKRPPAPGNFDTVSMSYKSRTGRTPSVVEADKQTSALLVESIQALSRTYDLSKETAKKLSEGVSNFRAHNLLSAEGKAKVGGAKMKGRVAINNFVSYRLKENIFALCVVLEHQKPVSEMKYIVLAPKSYLSNYKDLDQLIPITEEDDLGLIDGGEEFNTYGEALTVFSSLIEKVAPKKS
ncbi:hypothetical protein ICN28_06235 [Polynucleobacter sp. 30F-ANTBAC]|uniref:hypothetical protein n=1 Tax=Polynucleobacter sp. 30F-ANTBAC TaxID=2689095 RepID=UPI001C0D90CD|nr:hypothetical protein [Polynucleobacter sp. 30F-ANTBAC]MBU3600111.1 hypothetical protein [Polynucleobacter sp. 30F-ANTBAC]